MSEAKMGRLMAEPDPMLALSEQMRVLTHTVEQVRLELETTKRELENANAELRRNLLDGSIKVRSASKADSAKAATKAQSATMLEADAGHYLRFHQITAESRRAFELFRWDGEWLPLVELASAGPRW